MQTTIDNGTAKTASRYVKCLALFIGLTLVLVDNVHAEIRMTNVPVWTSGLGSGACGVAWTDLNADGWLDLFLSNGSDAASQFNYIYFNQGGSLASMPGWQSTDACTSGLPYVGDVNNDGYPDVAVSSMLTPASVLYYNGPGGLATTPGWYSEPPSTFNCVMGDPDGDGDLDLAFAQGRFADESLEQSAMYLNNAGVFGSTPFWETDSAYYGVEIAFGDVDLDGDLDLALTGKQMGLAVFYNIDGALETTPSFHTTATIGGRSLAFGDVNGDGYPDLAMARVGWPTFTGGEFQLFMNQGGSLEATPSWTSSVHESSAVAWGDMDGDGDLDLVAGSWYSVLGIYENVGGVLSINFAWRMNHSSGDWWINSVAVADYDEDGLIDTVESRAGDGATKLIKLNHQPIHELAALEIDGAPIPLSQYCYDMVDGWISLAAAPAPGELLTISYTFSNDLDLAVAYTGAGKVSVFENRLIDDPDLVNVLLLPGYQLGANWDINNSTYNIREQLEGFGWNITTAWILPAVPRCAYSISVGLDYYPSDLLVTEVENITDYDVLCLLPNASFSQYLYDYSPEAVALVREAADSGLIVAAWCKAVRILAAADVIDGLQVTGHADMQAAYEAAGATYMGSNHPPIVQGNIVTSVRSNYYRTEMCEAMRNAFPPELSQVQFSPLQPLDVDSVCVTAYAADFAGMDSVALMVDTGNGFTPMLMQDDGSHGDGGANDSTFGAYIPPVTGGKLVSFYVRVVDGVGISCIDPTDAPSSVYSFTPTTCCGRFTGGYTGNCNCGEDGLITLNDITTAIDHVYLTKQDLCCPANGNTNGSTDGLITLNDITTLINHVYITKEPTAECP
jgi:hypothetical protein